MIITDSEIKTKSGSIFDLHYRDLKNDTHSGFIRNRMWPKNCSIAIPKTHSLTAFNAIVDEVIENENKFNEANTLGRPRYYDILANGIEGLGETNKVFDLRESNPDFNTYKNSKRMWYYKTIGGHFNMKSIKINHVKLIDSVSFKKLMEFIDDQEVKDVLEGLRRHKFEYQADFLKFCDDLIDATEDTLISSYNKYIKSLFGTVRKLPRHKKDGKESITCYVYIPKDADPITKGQYRAKAMAQIPDGVHKDNIKIIELGLADEKIVNDARVKQLKTEKLAAIRKYFEDHKKKSSKKAEAAQAA